MLGFWLSLMAFDHLITTTEKLSAARDLPRDKSYFHALPNLEVLLCCYFCIFVKKHRKFRSIIFRKVPDSVSYNKNFPKWSS